MSMPTLSNELDTILTKAFNDFYDYITEKDIIKAAHEYSEKTVYKIARQALIELIATQNTALLKEVAEDMAALDNYNEHDDSVALYLKKKWGERSKLAAMGGQNG